MCQSSPALAGGCYFSVRIRAIIGEGFNPHPPLLAGATRLAHDFQRLLLVSILTRHCWRVLLAFYVVTMGGHGVSILTRHCWRVLPAPRQRYFSSSVVSILTRHCWRVLRSVFDFKEAYTVFQSSPAIAGGCYILSPTLPSQTSLFQSSPAIAGGCYIGRMALLKSRSRFQSSPAIAGGCYVGLEGTGLANASFNPHPPLLAGATISSVHHCPSSSVSILTRHCWRVLLPISDLLLASLLFQSSPAIAGGCYRGWAMNKIGAPRFNPHPPLLAGATLCSSKAYLNRTCFNPHPPLLAGATDDPFCELKQIIVSILTRHCWRVLHCR